MVVYNPATGEYEVDPKSFAMSSGDNYFDPVLGDIDPLNEHKGVGGGAGDNSYSSVGVDPSTLWDPTKGIDWNKLKQFITSPQGIAGLGGAALGYLDRPKPTGGGTTMAYPGAAKLERKMVQGPYGPLAEYTGVGGGAPDYTRFTAPKVEFPTVAPSLAPAPGGGLSVQAKVDLYKQLRGYGLSDERVRRIAETMFGPQTDSDWAELTRRAGPVASGIASGTPAAPRTAAPAATPSPAPASSQKSGSMRALGDIENRPIFRIDDKSTAQQKANEYNRLLAQGFTNAQIRAAADDVFGKQTDADWSYLTNLAARKPAAQTAAPAATPSPPAASNQKPSTKPDGSTQTIDPNKDYGFTRDPNAVGGMAMVPWYNKKTGQTYIAPDTAWRPPNEDWAKGEFDATGGVKKIPGKTPVSSTPPKEDPSTFTGPPSLQVSQGATAGEKAEEYRRLRRFGMSDSQIRAMVDARMGKQTDSDWQALLNLAMPSATPTGQQTSGGTDTTAEDPFIKSVREATGGGSQSPLYTDPISKSTLAVKKDYLGQPLEFTFTDKYGKSERVGASNTTPINELAEKYQIDLTKAFGAGTSETGGGLPWYGGLETTVDPKQYANVGAFTPGAPQQMVYSPEDKGLVFQPAVTGKDLGVQIPQMAAKPFADLESTLQKFKQTPPKTQEELVEANSAWLDYQNRFANSRAGYEPGRYDSSLKPVSMLSQTYTGYGPLNEALTNLSQQASSGTAQALTGSPFAGKEAQQLNQTIASVGSNPLVQQTLNKIAAIDPAAKFSTDDAARLAGQIQELGPQYAVANFIRDKQNLIGFGTNEWQSRLNTKDPTYAAYQNLLNNVSDLYSQPRLATGGITQGYAHGGLVHMEDGGFVLTKKAVDGAGGPRGIQQLVPGARMVRGPGTGTSDDIPAVINGPRGQTPARLSNGEAYVPKRFVQAQGGPQRMYALMNNLQRKA